MGIDLGQVYHSCYLDTDSDCPTGEECIIEISSSTNAHVADCESGLYDAFCCDYYFCGDDIVTTLIGEECDGTNLNGNVTCEDAHGSGTYTGSLSCNNCVFSGCSLLNCPDVPGCDAGTSDANECDGNTRYDCEMVAGCIAKTNEVDCTATGDVCLDESGCVDCIIDGDCSLPTGKSPEKLVDGVYYCNAGNTAECRDYYDSAPNPTCTAAHTCQVDISPTCVNCPTGCDSGTGGCNAECNPGIRDHISCYNNDEYWFDNCSNVISNDMETECGSSSCSWGYWQCTGVGEEMQRTQTGSSRGCSGGSCYIGGCSTSSEDCALSGKICQDNGVDEDAECVINVPYWTNMIGVKITSAELWDSVLMIYPDRGAESHDYLLKESDGGEGDDIRTIPAENNFNFNGDLAAMIRITQQDIDDSSGIGEGPEDDREFRFEVNSENIGGDDELIVSPNAIFNTPPTATITAPPEGSNYTLNYHLATHITNEITFSQSSYDVDDDIKVQWDFSDGTNSDWFENCLTTGDCNEQLTHNYTAPGTKSIKLIAQEMERGQWGWDSKNIFVYGEGLQVFSIIDSPFVTGRLVKLNASNSKLVNCTEGSQTKPGDNWYKVYDSEGEGETHSLWCNDFLRPHEFGASGYDFILKWTLDEGKSNEDVVEGLWSNSYEEVVEFSYVFPDLGVHTVKLEVGYFAE